MLHAHHRHPSIVQPDTCTDFILTATIVHAEATNLTIKSEINDAVRQTKQQVKQGSNQLGKSMGHSWSFVVRLDTDGFAPRQ